MRREGRTDGNRRRRSMANYVLLYHGGGRPDSAEENDRVMAAWGQWMGKLGPNLVDGGNPTSESRTVDASGTVSSTSGDPVTGYSIIKADSLDAAVAIAKECPIFQGPRPAKVDVYETFQAM
jgi:hypothetical protein